MHGIYQHRKEGKTAHFGKKKQKISTLVFDLSSFLSRAQY